MPARSEWITGEAQGRDAAYFSMPLPNTETLRRIVRLTWILPGLTFLLVAGIFLHRWAEGRRFAERQQEQRTLREAEENRRAFENLGGSRFEILHFYAAPAAIRRGESTSLCYGVSNAKSITLQPEEARIWPAANRCFSVSPRKDTTYTLTIADGRGQTKTASLVLRVQ